MDGLIIQMNLKLSKKDKDIVKFFLDTKNAPAYQKEISKGANVSERYLGGSIIKPGRLSLLVNIGVLEEKNMWVHKRGMTKWYWLSDTFIKSNLCREVAEHHITEKEIQEFLNHFRAEVN